MPTGYGRTRLYGIELAIVIFSTICVSISSQGFSESIDIVPWMVCMRIVMGIGIGAEVYHVFMNRHILLILF